MGRRVRLTKLRIASRISDLARLQAFRVRDAIRGVAPDIEIEFAFRSSLGDQNQNDPLWKMPGKGVFTEDFVSDLATGAADLVVHSWKDLPTEPRPGAEIAATLPRADARDVFLIRRSRLEQVQKTGELRVLTSSPRRAYNLENFFRTYLPIKVENVIFENVRGNVQTRLKKLLTLDADALIVAKAALDRLLEATEPEFLETQNVIREALGQTYFMVLPLSVNPTAAAQGALAIEIRSDRSDLKTLLAQINCADTKAAVESERQILSSYGGGCHQKIGVSFLKRSFGDVLFLRGLTDSGLVLHQSSLIKTAGEARSLKSQVRLFPGVGESAQFFEREELPSSEWREAQAAKALWVARETAWPNGLQPNLNQLVWTAGLTTWRRLALRGVWVHGTSDSLGEKEPTRIEVLARAAGLGAASDKNLNWLKLTHAGAGQAHESGSSLMASCATYRLIPKASVPDLRGRTHFYWMSGTAFDQALKLYPEIKDAVHASGPGRTHEHLVRALKAISGRDEASRKPLIYLNVEAFRDALKVPSETS